MSYQTAISGLDWSMVSSGITIPAAGISAMQTYEQSMGAIIAGNNVGVIRANVSSANYTGTINDIVYDVIVISGTISTNRTVNLYFDGSLNGNKRYTVLNDVVAVGGGLYTVTLTTGLGASVVLTAPASPSPTSMILIYVDTLGNVVAGGDIVSSGSNSNGSYIQFADGTMIQSGNAAYSFTAAPYSAICTVTFPISFITTSYQVSFTVITYSSSNETWAGASGAGGPSKATTKYTSYVTTFMIANGNQTATGTFDWIAIGKWK